MLASIADMMKPAIESSDDAEVSNNATALPSELEIAGKSLMVCMRINQFRIRFINDLSNFLSRFRRYFTNQEKKNTQQ